MQTTLLYPNDVDELLRYPRGRSARLARRGLITCIVLPDGELRFERDAIDAWLRGQVRPQQEVRP